MLGHNTKTIVFLLIVLGFATCPLLGQTLLVADGTTDTYTLVNSVLGAYPENPDCSHTSFGHHLNQVYDSDLGKSVFNFNIHVTPDNDRCTNFDRQRLEIKTDGSAPNALKGFLNDTVTYRWKFKLPTGFQPSTAFTHIHQIKAGDGDAGAPLITLTPRKASPNQLQLIWSTGNGGQGGTLSQTALAPFIGVWVEVYEKVTYSHSGKYSIVIKRLNDGATLFSYSNNNLDLWRDSGTTFCRPKWGIYRSLNDSASLRDEQLHFDRFCIAKAPADCGSDGFEAEASGNTLSGAAAVATCSGCSGGKKVGHIGNNSANFVTINNVTVPTTGTYVLTIYGVVSGTRQFSVSVNGGSAVPVSLTGTSWSQPVSSPPSINIPLSAGINTIRLFNDSAYGPDLDRITVTQ